MNTTKPELETTYIHGQPIIIHKICLLSFLSNGQKLVDQTVAKIKSLLDSGELKPGQYKFLTYLMQKEELDYKDMSIITLSLFADGLSTVSHISSTEIHN